MEVEREREVLVVADEERDLSFLEDEEEVEVEVEVEVEGARALLAAGVEVPFETDEILSNLFASDRVSIDRIGAKEEENASLHSSKLCRRNLLRPEV